MMPGVTLTERREAGPHFFHLCLSCHPVRFFPRLPPIVLFAL